MGQIYTIKRKPLKGKRDYRVRRVWSLKQKQEILALARQTSTLNASRVFDLDIRLLFQWRAHERMGELAQHTWKDPGRPKRRNRPRDEVTLLQIDEMADEDF
jgi:hypothetical protein